MSYIRKCEDKRRLIKLSRETSSRYPQNAYFDTRKQRYIRIWKSDRKDYTYLKREARRAMRRADYPNKNQIDVYWRAF